MDYVKAFLIGGGIGIPPMLQLAKALNEINVYSRSLLGNVPDVMANYAAGSALYYADNRLYISVLTTSASKLSYVDLTADIFWPISIGQISAAPVALYSAMQNAAADDAAALAPWAERQTGMQALEPAAAETLTAQPLPALQ